MTEKDYKDFCNFINKVLYETMSIDDYEIILNELGANIRRRNSDTWQLPTICHNIDQHDAKSNLTFYIDSRSFYCFSECNRSFSLLSLIEQRFKILGKPKSKFKCMKWLCKRLSIPFDFKDNSIERDRSLLYDWKSKLLKYTKGYNKEEYEKVIYDQSVLDYFEKSYHTDWLVENIKEETLDKYGIKWYNYKQQIVIPCYDDLGQLIGIRIRNMNPNEAEMWGKYRPLEMLDGTEYKFPTNQYFYGANYTKQEICRRKECVLVESEKSILKADGWFGDKNITLGMYGHILSKAKLDMLIDWGVEIVTICLDWDYIYTDSKEYERYIDNVNKIYFMLKPYMKEIYVMVNILEEENNGENLFYKSNPFDFSSKSEFDDFWNGRLLIE